MVTEAQQVAESTGVLGSLGVNWKLFLAQLVNFSLVMFVMWRWVYRPLLAFMDERTAKIEKGLQDAEVAASARQRAEAERDTLVANARQQVEKIIEAAETSAISRREELLAKAKQDVEKVVQQGKSQLKVEQETMLREARASLADLVAKTTELVLADIIDPKKDAALIKSAVKKFAKTE